MADTLPQSISEVLADYVHAYAALGFIPIPLKDKVPVISAWQKEPAGADNATRRLRGHRGNIGLALPDDEISSQALWEILDEKRRSGSQPWFFVSELDQRTSELITQSMEVAKC